MTGLAGNWKKNILLTPFHAHFSGAHRVYLMEVDVHGDPLILSQ